MEKKKVKDSKMLFYESFADSFDSKMNMYDTNKRIDVVFNELLVENIEDKLLLDAGAGTGWFSKHACERKANVISMDLGENLLRKVKEKCNSTTIIGSILNIPFGNDFFDVVISSEVIEHTPNPYLAIHELYRVLKPGGILILTTPNKYWYFSVWLANLLNLRPYQGYENWTGWFQMKKVLKETGFNLQKIIGIHLFPFIFPATYPILNYFHKYNKILGPIMVNIAVKCTK